MSRIYREYRIRLPHKRQYVIQEKIFKTGDTAVILSTLKSFYPRFSHWPRTIPTPFVPRPPPHPPKGNNLKISFFLYRL